MSTPRLLRWLTLFALVLAPLVMIGAAPASAHVPTAATGHCSQSEAPADAPPSAPIDCMIGCAGLPAQSGVLSGRPPLVPGAEPSRLPSRLHGVHPEAETPPPRSS